MSDRRLTWVIVASVVLAAVLGLTTGCDLLSPSVDSGTVSTFDTIPVRQLPPEARQTLELIASNGPFPYSKDGAVFHNYEGLLPKKRDGYYREYTVMTPGSADRGARRIVAGEKGERYYTDDHYNSFRLVVE